MGNILLIEDDPLMCRMYERAFTLFDYRIESATDGEKGLERARQERPAVILLDVMMPKMNGLDVLKRLKEQTETKDIPVIILTNSVSDKVIEAAIHMGAVKYIVKSDYDPEQVVKMVGEVLEAKEAPKKNGQVKKR